MIKPEQSAQLIDRYLRDELPADEEATFETRMLESPDLQLQLETAMAIRQAILLKDENDVPDRIHASPAQVMCNSWQPFALAASLLLAIFSTTSYWKVSNETGLLQAEINALNQPRTVGQTRTLDIMRSTDQQSADISIRKRNDNTLLVLQVELSAKVISLGQVHMSLRDAQTVELLAWESDGFEGDWVTVAFDTKTLPTGRVWLEMSDPQGQVLDRRSIDFLPQESAR